jgi:hypothetical protein
MAAWDRVSGIVLGVIGLHLFIYFATVSCVVSASAKHSHCSMDHAHPCLLHLKLPCCRRSLC